MGTDVRVADREARTGLRALAWILLVASLALSLSAVALVLANAARPSRWATILSAVTGLAFPVVGLLIARRQPANPIGWLFLTAGVALASGAAMEEVIRYRASTGGSVGQTFLSFYALGGGWWALGIGSVLVLPLLLFPDGHPLSRRWRIAVWIEGIAIAALTLSLPFSQDATEPFGTNPLASRSLAPIMRPLATGVIVFIGMIPVAVVALVKRYRRSHGAERDQLKWFTLGGAIAASSMLIGVSFDAANHPEARANIIGIGIMAIPITAGIAMLRYKLWDIDVVIKKALVFGLIVVTVTLISAGVLLLVPLMVVGDLSGWEQGLFLVGVVIGTLFGPLRRAARRAADRLVYGSRATPYEVLTAFSGRIAETYATDDVLPRMAHVLASGTGATSARVLLRVRGALQEVALYGERGDDGYVAAVLYQGEDVGALAVRMPANDPMTPSKEKLVEDLAAQAGPVLRNVRLIEELKASRQRLVAAQDEQRRKIERDIHDGAQQQLVALAVQLKLAGQMVDRDAGKAKALLEQLQGAAGSALEDLRDLARGIYPPLLADKGLRAALEAQARKAAMPVTVESDGIERFSQEVEATVYFCTLEALNNVAKYANATRATVRLVTGHGDLRFEVEDDGAGFDPSATGYGTGLQGMADRLAALGGTLSVTSALGSGTTIEGRLPA